jgi:SOS-response transcriptional repressor LexA
MEEHCIMADTDSNLLSPKAIASKNTFALQVRGDSMDTPDGYREGETVYIDPDISPTPGRDVLAKTDSGITLKRYKVDEEGPYLLQLNGNKIIRPEGTWHVCGVVVFSGRTMKECGHGKKDRTG